MIPNPNTIRPNRNSKNQQSYLNFPPMKNHNHIYTKSKNISLLYVGIYREEKKDFDAQLALPAYLFHSITFLQ